MKDIAHHDNHLTVSLCLPLSFLLEYFYHIVFGRIFPSKYFWWTGLSPREYQERIKEGGGWGGGGGGLGLNENTLFGDYQDDFTESSFDTVMRTSDAAAEIFAGISSSGSNDLGMGVGVKPGLFYELGESSGEFEMKTFESVNPMVSHIS